MKGGEELDSMDDLERRFRAAMTDPRSIRAARRATLRLNLSRRTRLRRWCTSRCNLFGCWLADRRQFRAAKAVWRIKGRWRTR